MSKEIRPNHYNQHPCGIEPKRITDYCTFNIGNAIKYLMRYLYKGNPEEDLRKAQTYIGFELEKMERDKRKNAEFGLEADDENAAALAKIRKSVGKFDGGYRWSGHKEAKAAKPFAEVSGCNPSETERHRFIETVDDSQTRVSIVLQGLRYFPEPHCLMGIGQSLIEVISNEPGGRKEANVKVRLKISVKAAVELFEFLTNHGIDRFAYLENRDLYRQPPEIAGQKPATEPR